MILARIVLMTPGHHLMEPNVFRMSVMIDKFEQLMEDALTVQIFRGDKETTSMATTVDLMNAIQEKG